jgi:hypothetical protein
VRLIVPLLPVLAVFIVTGVRTLADLARLPSGVRRLAVVLAVLAAVPLWMEGWNQFRSTRRAIARVRGTPVVYRWHDEYIDLARRHASALADGDVVATNHPRILRYFLPPEIGLATLPILQDAGAGYRALLEARATHLFCDKSEALIWDSTRNIISAHPPAFELVADTEEAAVYRRSIPP